MSQSGSLRWFLIALVILAVGGPFALFWVFPDQRELVVRLEENVAELSAAVEPLRATFGLSETSSEPAVPGATAVTEAGTDRRSPQATAAPAAGPFEPPAVSPPAVVGEGSRPAAAQAGSVDDSAFEEMAIAVDDHVYSSLDAEVVPPEPLQPLLRTDAPGVGPWYFGTVEFIVNEAGDVTTVRLVRQSGNAFDGMLLAAIKAWRFTPAFKGGQPVKYRQTIVMTR